MPRVARTVVANVPHHITQRGNRREAVFFVDEDRTAYLGWLREYAEKHGVEVLAYCLMTNHVHLVAVPPRTDSLHSMLKPLHMRFAQRINRQKGWSGHVWQGRFFSSPLDEDYLWAAIRYVERNPVRAGMVAMAESYDWSSAPAHCGLTEDPLVNSSSEWQKQLATIGDWSAWLAGAEDNEKLAVLRRNTDMSLPCGCDAFIKQLEDISGRSLLGRQRGRPKSVC